MIIFKKLCFIFFFITFVILSLNLKEYNYNFDLDIVEGSIKVGFWLPSIKYGGRERVISILLNYLSKEKYFTFYLITSSGILEGEYEIPAKINRISLLNPKINIISLIKKEKLDIFIYNSYNKKIINKLNIMIIQVLLIGYCQDYILIILFTNRIKIVNM